MIETLLISHFLHICKYSVRFPYHSLSVAEHLLPRTGSGVGQPVGRREPHPSCDWSTSHGGPRAPRVLKSFVFQLSSWLWLNQWFSCWMTWIKDALPWLLCSSSVKTGLITSVVKALYSSAPPFGAALDKPRLQIIANLFWAFTICQECALCEITRLIPIITQWDKVLLPYHRWWSQGTDEDSNLRRLVSWDPTPGVPVPGAAHLTSHNTASGKKSAAHMV